MAPKQDPFPGAEAWIPERPTLRRLMEAMQACRGCDLYRRATQAVGGEGSARASVVFVGEQPGDAEDRAGRPFVGPAGRLLDQALARAGIARSEVYVTNVVKHFSWQPRPDGGKRRIHKKPTAKQIRACRPWLDAELAIIQPTVLVCLGATAAQALLGREFKVSEQRGRLIPSDLAPFVMATVHPSAVLRAPDPERRREERRLFYDDIEKVAYVIHRSGAPGRGEPPQMRE